MLPNMPQMQGSKEERKLCKIYKQLSEVDRHSLLRFADFLLNSQEETSEKSHSEPISSKPLDIPRPKKESVIKAIRRLTATYPMIDKDSLFEKTSTLMTEHVMQGRAADNIIDELEEIFAHKYKEFDNG